MRITSLFVAAICAAVSLPSSRAAVVYVNRNATGAVHDGTSWQTAYVAIADGLSVAKGGDELWVAKGTYQEHISPGTGVAIYGGFAGIEAERQQRDWKANATVADAGGSTDAVVSCGFPDIVVDGMTLRNGHNFAVNVLSSGAVTLSNDTITGNFTYGVYVYGGAATLINNTLSANGLAAVYVRTSGSAVLSHNTISGSSGAGVVVATATATLTDNTICSNGMGVAVETGTATLTNNTISGNTLDAVAFYPGTGTLANNIIAFNGGWGVDAGSLGVIAAFSHNDVYGNSAGDNVGFTPSAGQGNISADPRFPNIYHDIHIQPDSPCRDAGDDSFGNEVTDIDGQPRIQGTHVDIGSDESDGTVWQVPTNTWLVTQQGSDANDGLTWQTAKRTVTAALAAAQGTDEIWVAEGTYNETIMPGPALGLYGGFAGTETARNQRDWKANPTVIDGGGGTQPVARVWARDDVIDGFTLRNGTDGVYSYSPTAVFSNDTITGNAAKGADVVGGTATIAGCRVTGNTYGVYANGGMAVVTNSTVSGNTSDGVYASTFGPATVAGSTISGNGGKGVNANGGAATITSSTVYGNASDGLYVGVHGKTTIANSTICGNGGSGLYSNYGLVTLINTIVAFNAASGLKGTSTSFTAGTSHNDVYANVTGNYAGFTPPAGQGNLSLDPLFIDAATGNYRLQGGSPCIDAGDDNAVTAGETDADGKPRIIGLHVDIGAYEYDSTLPAPFTVADVKQALGIAGGLVAPSPDVATRLSVEAGAPVDIADAARIARKVVGLETNP